MLKYSYFPHQFLRNSGCFFVNVSRQPKVFFLQCRNFFKKLYAGIKEKKFLKEKCLILWQQSSQSFFWFNLIRSREEVGRGGEGGGGVGGGEGVEVVATV